MCNGKDPQAPLEPIRDPHGTGHAMRLWERGKQWETPRMGEQGRGYGGRGGQEGSVGGGKGEGGVHVYRSDHAAPQGTTGHSCGTNSPSPSCPPRRGWGCTWK